MANEQNELTLFDKEELVKWKEHWKDMPEFVQEDLTPVQQVIVSFKSEEDRNEFAKLVGQKLTYKTQSIWYPAADIDRIVDKIYVDADEEAEQVARYLDSRKDMKTPPSDSETPNNGEIEWLDDKDPPPVKWEYMEQESNEDLTFEDDLLL